MLITITHGGITSETDSALEAIKTVIDFLKRGRDGTIEVAPTVLPPVGDGGPDMLQNLADGGQVPRKLRKQRSDKGKPRRK